MDYNQRVNYIDGTFDENFNNARQWAKKHNTTFLEDIRLRDLPNRVFVIGPKPVKPEPTVEEMMTQVRAVRNGYLQDTDRYMLEDYPVTSEEKELCKQYRKYLRDYTEEENWWLQNPLTFEDWKQGREFIEEME